MAKQKNNLPPARRAVLAALAAILPDPATPDKAGPDAAMGLDAQAALDHALKALNALNAQHTADKPDQREAGLATEVVYGYLRLKGRIEHILSGFLKAPEKLPRSLHQILGAAAYEILYLDRVPTYASVNWAVDAVRATVSPKLSGLANAVLRRVGGLGNEVHEKSFYVRDGEDTESVATLSRFYSCPQWIVRLFLEAYGPTDAERLLRAQILPPALGVALPAGAPEAQAEQLAALPGLLAHAGRGFAFPAGTRLESFLESTPLVRGSFAAREALLALDPASWPGPVWDACSGRGGKTRVLAELGVDVRASDVHRGRIRALETEQPDVPATVASALEGPPEAIFGGETPGTILLDAPCSGLGVLSRRPDTKWRRHENDLEELERLQRGMLDAAAKSGARSIAYLTCTMNPQENEAQVAAFLERHAEFSEAGRFATPPSSLLGEFFFGALLVRG